jgi:hypothetical protein
MNSRQRKHSIVLSLLIFLLCGCSLIPQPRHGVQIHIEQPITSPHQPFRVIQVCLDTPPLYPARYFHEAAEAIANRIDASVTVNQDGMDVFVTVITSNSFQHDVLSFSVPSFPADPPAPVKPKLGDDPYNNATAKQTYQNAFASWQATLIARHHKLATLTAQVKQETNQLRSLPAPFDAKGDDPWGCLADAAQHMSGIPGEKYLVIASPLIATTTLQKTPTLNLSGVSVRAIFHTCTVASTCQQNENYWTQQLLHDGATDVRFYDPAQEEASPVTF